MRTRRLLLWALLMTTLSATVTTAQVAYEGTEAAVQEQLTIRSTDGAYTVDLPSPKWDAQAGEDLAAEGAPGCAGAARFPPGYLTMSPKAAAEVRLMPQTFLVRSREEFDNVLRTIRMSLQSQPGFEAGSLQTEEVERDGMLWRYYTFTSQLSGSEGMGGCAGAPRRGGSAEKLKFFVADCFVRPDGGTIQFYRIRCAAPVSLFDDYQEEFRAIAESFHYAGRVAEEFFTPDAPPEKLPDLDAMSRAGAPRCGGGSSGFFLVIGLVLMIYVIMKRRRRSQEPTL